MLQFALRARADLPKNVSGEAGYESLREALRDLERPGCYGTPE